MRSPFIQRRNQVETDVLVENGRAFHHARDLGSIYARPPSLTILVIPSLDTL